MDKHLKLDNKILAVAERLFLEKGFGGTSTTEIAKEVGCNQALIHYYFRTKEKLFWDIFAPKMELIVGHLDAPLAEDMDFFDRLNNIIDYYFGFLELNERLAPFIVNELLMNPDRWEMFRMRFLRGEKRTSAFSKFSKMVQDEIDKGTLRKVEAIDILLNIMSLTLSTFIIAPKGYANGECDSTARKQYLDYRRDDIKKLIVNGLRA